MRVKSFYNQVDELLDIYNIYTHKDLPIKFVDTRSPLQKVKDEVFGELRNLNFFFKELKGKYSSFFNRKQPKEYCDPDKPETWRTWEKQSVGLHLFIHGFRGHPSIWERYIKTLKINNGQADIRAPFVPKTGDCSLEQASASIKNIAKSYLLDQIAEKENDLISLNITGVSNGGRVALNILDGLIDEDIENALKEKNLKVVIKVNSIAGVLRGTTNWSLRFANLCKFTRWIAEDILKISPEALNEFQYESETSTQLLDKTRTIQNSEQVAYKFDFYATTEDHLVEPYTSSLPVLGKGEGHHIIHAEGHIGIVDRVLEHVLFTSSDWIAEQNNSMM